MNKTNLSAYMAMTVSQLKEEQRMRTAHVYQSTFNRIKDFMEQNSISFEEVTPVWLKAFLGGSSGGNGISNNKRSAVMTNLFALPLGLEPRTL